jgi:hypothetical protein
MKCQGPLEMIDSSRKREGLEAKKYVATEAKPLKRRCPSCGSLVLSNADLFSHLIAEQECLQYHIDEDKLLPVSDSSNLLVVPGSIHVKKSSEKPRSRPWVAIAVSESGSVVELIRSAVRQECRDFVSEHFGPVELAR